MSNKYQSLINDVLKIGADRKKSLNAIRNSIATGDKKGAIRKVRAYFDKNHYTKLEFAIKETLMKEDFETAFELLGLL